jgi:hypothetical protein
MGMNIYRVFQVCVYLYIYMNMFMYLSTYIYTCLCIHINVCIYINDELVLLLEIISHGNEHLPCFSGIIKKRKYAELNILIYVCLNKYF